MTETLEPTFTVPEIAGRLQLSRQTVIRMFENEPGVILIERPGKMHKRKYRTVGVPRHVYERDGAKLPFPRKVNQRLERSAVE
jgi:predicted transcriptional regulator